MHKFFSKDLEHILLKYLIICFKDRLWWLLSGVNQVLSIYKLGWMAKYRNFWVTRADTKSVSPLCSLEKMQKSIAQKALQCLCPHMNSIFSQLLLIYLPRQTDASWGLLPILCHQRWAGVKTQQSICWKTELVQKPWFASPNLLYTHLYLFMYILIHIWLKEHLLVGEPSLQTGASCLLPSVHNFSLLPLWKASKSISG